MKSPSDLIVIGNRDSCLENIISGLTTSQWSVEHIGDVNQLRSCLAAKRHLVGVIYIDASQDNFLDDLSVIINEFETRWLAICASEKVLMSQPCRMIGHLLCGYHTLPVSIEQLQDTLKHLHSLACLGLTSSERASISQDTCTECPMVGESQVMKTLFRTVHKVAAVDAPVFIQGESGTGKELTARAIHEESSRSGHAFNAVNCGALPANLIQSELFGHEKGAFTGATQRKVGIIESTEGGTLFLDEIGDLPLEMQVNLLRFLENHTIQRVGGLKEIPVDVRVLAATHVDLEKAVENGTFREDLYHRLNVLQVQVPPLRERGNDIEVLANHFFERFSNEKSMQVKGFTKESLAIMRLYEWPGNIRELINRVRRAMVMCEHPLIRPADLGLERRHSASRYARSLEEARDMAERNVVMAALARNSFNVQHAARELGISRVTLYRLMEKHKIHREAQDPPHSNSGGRHSAANVLHFTASPRGRE